jgi:uncharacterized protein
VIYLDASALITFVTGRQYAADLERFLVTHPDVGTATSTVGLVETVRALNRVGDFPGAMATLQREHTEVLVTEEIRDAAAQLPGNIRTLDAIHVASAQAIGEQLTVLVSYDRRMVEVAQKVGLRVAAPGFAD